MSEDAALAVLRDIWQARGQIGPEVEELFGPAKTCKRMRDVGFDGVDDDLRAAWRDRLAREGKLRP
jgi:hypothetical protein